jgi:hypothetical protein
MRRIVDNCVGCGLLPCYHCTAEEYVCDECGEVCDELYEDKNGCEVCEDCLLKGAKLT